LNPLHLSGARGFPFAKTADEEAALPSGETVAGVERPTRHGDRRYPHHCRRLELLTPRVLRDLWSHVVAPIAHVRPAVIRPRLEHVDFVTAVRALLSDPELSGLWIERHRVPVPMAECVDAGLVAGFVDEWVIGRNGPVVAKPHGLPGVIVRIG